MSVLHKTPCASATLAYFGVSGTTWNDRTKKNVWDSTLRRAGYSLRSRKSKIGESTVGGARGKMIKIANADTNIKAFIVHVKGHVLVLDRGGNTVVDTAPRRTDRRQIVGVWAVM